MRTILLALAFLGFAQGASAQSMTDDQVKQLATDNVVSAAAKSFADLGIEPTPMASVLPDYLWRYRPSGQYAEIKASAGNLRADG